MLRTSGRQPVLTHAPPPHPTPCCSPPVELRFDRPFVFDIVHEPTGMTLVSCRGEAAAGGNKQQEGAAVLAGGRPRMPGLTRPSVRRPAPPQFNGEIWKPEEAEQA